VSEAPTLVLASSGDEDDALLRAVAARLEARGIAARVVAPDPERIAGAPFIGGFSLGARVALGASREGVRGLVLLGFPFHPRGAPGDTSRLVNLEVDVDTLVVQGERDAHGNRARVTGYALSPRVQVAWIEDGNHRFEPRARAGRTLDENLERVADAIAAFVS
jgi:predicted alpha/beta-hydrolase family hydrolase